MYLIGCSGCHANCDSSRFDRNWLNGVSFISYLSSCISLISYIYSASTATTPTTSTISSSTATSTWVSQLLPFATDSNRDVQSNPQQRCLFIVWYQLLCWSRRRRRFWRRSLIIDIEYSSCRFALYVGTAFSLDYFVTNTPITCNDLSR